MFLERGGLLAISGIRDSLVKIECHIYSGYVYMFRACASPVLRLSIENLVGGFGIRNRPGVSIAQDDWIVSQRSGMKRIDDREQLRTLLDCTWRMALLGRPLLARRRMLINQSMRKRRILLRRRFSDPTIRFCAPYIHRNMNWNSSYITGV